MQFFSYRPRSGSRVIAAKPVDGVVIADAWCGTICAGDVVALSYVTAEPGSHWRVEAGRLASEIVEAVGGLAEDARGVVSIVVPRRHAVTAHELMSAVDKQPRDGALLRDPNRVALWKAGCLLVQSAADGGIAVVPRHAAPHEGAFTVCPVALPDKQRDDGTLQTNRRAVRVGRTNEAGEWMRVYADLHRDGGLIPVQVFEPHRAVRQETIHFVSDAGFVHFDADRAYDAVGNLVEMIQNLDPEEVERRIAGAVPLDEFWDREKGGPMHRDEQKPIPSL